MTHLPSGSSSGEPPKRKTGVPRDEKVAGNAPAMPGISPEQASKAYKVVQSDFEKRQQTPVQPSPQKAGASDRQHFPLLKPEPTGIQIAPASAGIQINAAPDQIQISPAVTTDASRPVSGKKPGDVVGESRDVAKPTKTSAPARATPGEAFARSPAATPPEGVQNQVAAPEPAKPTWKEVEPDDPNDAVPHIDGVCYPLDEQWDLVAGSVRGKLHAHKAMYRDDAFASACVDGWHILVVSDGAGSAKLSRVGARVACDAAAGAMKTMLSGFKLSSGKGPQPPDRELLQLRSFLTLAMCEARDAIIREAHQRGISDRDLYCTLLLNIHTKWKEDMDLLAAIQVGDGAIGVHTGDGKCTLMGVADHGEYSGEVVFVTSFKQLIEKPYDRRVLFAIKRDVRSVGLMSDGVSDDFFPEDTRLIELFVGDPIGEIRDSEGQPVKGVLHGVLREADPKDALLKWLKYEKKGSSDDRTLLLMYRKDKR